MRLTIFLWLFTASEALGSAIFMQFPSSPPGGGIPSQQWYDPSGQNNLDSDAIAYDDFVLTEAKTITRVDWWGEAGPSVGFFVEFYNQDPNTVACQPDLVQFHGDSPIATELVTNFTQTLVGNSIYQFSADLANPVTLDANTSANPRYFFSVSDSMPLAYYTWAWAQGFDTGLGPGTTFYYQIAGSLAGGPYYSVLPSDRAFGLFDASAPEPSALLLSSCGLIFALWRRRCRRLAVS